MATIIQSIKTELKLFLETNKEYDEIRMLEANQHKKFIFMISISVILMLLSSHLLSYSIPKLEGHTFITISILLFINQFLCLSMLRNDKIEEAANILILGLIFNVFLAAIFMKFEIICTSFNMLFPLLTQLVSNSSRLHCLTTICCLTINILNTIQLRSLFLFMVSPRQEDQIKGFIVVSFLFIVFNSLVSYNIIQFRENINRKFKKNKEKSDKINKELVAALQAKELFIAGLSHEIRNPLNSIVGSIDLLLKYIIEPIIREIVINAKQCSEILLNLLNNLLDAAKLNSNDMEVSLVDTRIIDIIDKLIKIHKPLIEHKGMNMTIRINKNLPNMISIDSSRLLQILMNLISNAIKFTNHNGKISLTFTRVNNQYNLLNRSFGLLPSEISINKLKQNSCKELWDVPTDGDTLITKYTNFAKFYDYDQFRNELDNDDDLDDKGNDLEEFHIVKIQHNQKYDLRSIFQNKKSKIEEPLATNLEENNNYLKIEINDTGCGISENDQSKLFQMFSQVDSSISRKNGGIGLGLWICKQLCLKMGGDIKIYSKIGKGTTLVFYLPFNQVSNVRLHTRTTLDQNEKRCHRGLLVDDLAFNNQLHQAILDKIGVQSKLAQSGKEALQIYTIKPDGYFNFIFMDLQMPEIDGKTTCKMIREFERNNGRAKIDIYIISGNILINDLYLI